MLVLNLSAIPARPPQRNCRELQQKASTLGTGKQKQRQPSATHRPISLIPGSLEWEIQPGENKWPLILSG